MNIASWVDSQNKKVRVNVELVRQSRVIFFNEKKGDVLPGRELNQNFWDKSPKGMREDKVKRSLSMISKVGKISKGYDKSMYLYLVLNDTFLVTEFKEVLEVLKVL